MKKLTAIDANFLYSETKKTPGHVASVQVMELPENVSVSEFIRTLKIYLTGRLHLIPYLTQKLSYVPGNLDHPVWVNDPNMNIENHVIEYPVAAPGTKLQMEEAVATIHAENMDLSRPLWALYVLTGLEGGKVAYYNQFHHSAIDGVSGQLVQMILMDETPDHPAIPAAVAEPQIAEEESQLSIVEDAFSNFMRFQTESGKRWLGAMETSRLLLQRSFDPSKDFGALGKTAPATPFNSSIAKKRVWSADELPLSELKQMGKVVQCTMNDVLLAICGGALRTYLARKNALPEQDLIAGCPVSLHKPGDTEIGTRVTMMGVELATSIADPLERLLMIRESARTAKEVTSDLAGAYEGNASIPGLPAFMRANAKMSETWSQFNRGPYNVVISNVPGPKKTLYSNGARMLTHYPVSIPAHGMGLNITVQSYVDTVYLGVTACGKSVPDLGVLRDDLMTAYEELRQRLLRRNVSDIRPATSPVLNITPKQEPATASATATMKTDTSDDTAGATGTVESAVRVMARQDTTAERPDNSPVQATELEKIVHDFGLEKVA